MTPTRTSGTLHPRPALVVRICGSRYKNQKNTRRRTRGRKMKKIYGPLPYKLQKKRPSSPKEKQRKKITVIIIFLMIMIIRRVLSKDKQKKNLSRKKLKYLFPLSLVAPSQLFFPFSPKNIYISLSLSLSLFPPFVTEETAPFILPRLRGFPLSPPQNRLDSPVQKDAFIWIYGGILIL